MRRLFLGLALLAVAGVTGCQTPCCSKCGCNNAAPAACAQPACGNPACTNPACSKVAAAGPMDPAVAGVAPVDPATLPTVAGAPAPIYDPYAMAGNPYGRMPAHFGNLRMPPGHHYRPPTDPRGYAPQYAYPYYTIRGPRDFLVDNPPSIGPY